MAKARIDYVELPSATAHELTRAFYAKAFGWEFTNYGPDYSATTTGDVDVGLNGQPYPVFKNFYSGGLGSVRGFEQGTLGPRDITGASIGGPKKVTFNFELAAPFPGAGNDRTLRLFAFTDMGNVFAENQKVAFADFRASAGVGVSWLSPVGPLRIAFAQPVRTQPGDRIQKIQFQIGTSF